MVQGKFTCYTRLCKSLFISIAILSSGGSFAATTPATKTKDVKLKSGKKAAPAAAAKSKITTLQEGWYKVTVGGVHAGYFVQRVEFNSSSKQFIATTYLRTSAVGGNINESLKSYAADNLAPVSYQYTSLTAKGGKTIDATFKKSVGSLVITEDGKVRTEQVKFKDGSLLSSMLVYTILRNKVGVKTGNNYGYVAVAEEEGRAYNGTSWVQEETNYEGQSAFKILNKFKDQQFLSYVTPTGKILATRFPAENIEMKLVPSRDEAVGTVPVNDKTLALLFGQLPAAGAPATSAKAVTGAKGADENNSVVVDGKTSPTDSAKPAPGKSASEKATQMGVPEGMSVPPGKGDAADLPINPGSKTDPENKE